MVTYGSGGRFAMTDPLHRQREINLDVSGRRSAEMRGVAHVGIDPRRPDQRLRRHAADIQAVAADQVTLDQRNPGPEGRRTPRRHQTRRPGTNDHEVVAARRFGIAPAARPDTEQKVGVVATDGKLRMERLVMRHSA